MEKHINNWGKEILSLIKILKGTGNLTGDKKVVITSA